MGHVQRVFGGCGDYCEGTGNCSMLQLKVSHVCGKTVACYNLRYKVQRLIPSSFAARVLLPPALARASSMVSGCRVVSEDGYAAAEESLVTCRGSCSTESGRSLTDMMFDVQRIMARSITCSSSLILPGQSCARNRSMTLSDTPRISRSNLSLNRLMKWVTRR